MSKGYGLTKLTKKIGTKKINATFALPSYNLYFLPLMTGQTDLTIVAVVYVLGLFKSRPGDSKGPLIFVCGSGESPLAKSQNQKYNSVGVY